MDSDGRNLKKRTSELVIVRATKWVSTEHAQTSGPKRKG